jgi:hypothetical protein
MRKQMLKTGILIFFYSGWISLLFFVPIASRFSDGGFGGKLQRALAGPALVGICLLSPILVAASGLWLGVRPVDLLPQFLFVIAALYDMPSLVLILVTITACRLGMGKLQDRYDWVPISILIGVLWTLHGIVIMLSNVDAATFGAGYQVALLATLYGCMGAIAVLVNRAWFFTIIGAIFATCMFALVVVSNILASDSYWKLIWLGFGIEVVMLGGVLGRFCDMFYLSVTRYESFGGFFYKHKIDWIVFGVLIGLGVLTAFLRVLSLLWSR